MQNRDDVDVDIDIFPIG